MENFQCQKIREEIAMGDRLSSSAENTTKSEVDRHLRDCENCRAWAEQSDQIVNLTKEIPQFDVPEAVTQRILQAVAEENKPSFLSNDYGIWLGAAAVTTLAVFVLSDTVENLEGLASWSVGLAVIMIVRLVILRFPSPKAVHQ